MEKARVLAVDDEEALLRGLRRLLARFDVTTCVSIADARRQLSAARFDVVVSDVNVGGTKDGLDFFKSLRESDPEQAARFLFISGNAGDSRLRELLDATGAPYLSKPFDAMMLRDIVTCLSEGRQPRRTSSARRLWIGSPHR